MCRVPAPASQGRAWTGGLGAVTEAQGRGTRAVSAVTTTDTWAGDAAEDIGSGEETSWTWEEGGESEATMGEVWGQ